MYTRHLNGLIGVTAWCTAAWVTSTHSSPAAAQTTSDLEAHRIDENEARSSAPAQPTSRRLLAAASGREMKIERDVLLLIGEGASARPGYTGALMVGRDGGRIRVQTVKVSDGRVDAVLPPAKKERGVLFAGPDSISAISSEGRLALSVTQERVFVESLHGRALAGSKGRFQPLLPGVVRVFDRLTGRSVDEPLGAPARIEATRAVGVALTGAATMGVKAIGDSTHCVSVLDRDGEPIGSSRCGPAGQTIEIEVPHAGTFRAVARRLGEGSMGGSLSAPVKLQVLGLAEGQEPPRDGVFFLERWQRVELKGTEGLELRYGVSKVFVPAPSSLGLPMGRGTTVELRHPRSPEQSTRIRLAPRYGKIEASIGPPNPHWPDQALDVVVKARDGVGRLLPEGDRIKLQISVNGYPLEATWAFTREGLVTSIPPQRGLGPWVVRVSVFDDKGKIIGRDVIDVLRR